MTETEAAGAILVTITNLIDDTEIDAWHDTDGVKNVNMNGTMLELVFDDDSLGFVNIAPGWYVSIEKQRG